MLPQGQQLGGAPANFAYHVSKLGMQGVVVSAIGNDALGDEIMSFLEDKNLDLYLMRVKNPTGVVNIELNNVGIPMYNIVENVAWDSIPFTSELEVLAQNTKAVCFGSLAQRKEVSRNTILKYLKMHFTQIGHNRTTVYYNSALPFKEISKEFNLPLKRTLRIDYY